MIEYGFCSKWDFGIKPLRNLMASVDRSAGNTMSSWPIFLYSMAIAAAKLENKWKDAFDGYNKLSQTYKARKKFEQSGL